MDVIAPPDANRAAAAELEYAALREESLKRIEQRQQILSVTLTLAGAFLGIGWNSGGAVAILIFPLLAALLMASWAHNELRLSWLTTYIREQLEPLIPGTGYERYAREREQASRLVGLPIDVFAIGGVFLLTQMLAVVLALFRFNGMAVEWVLLVLAGAAILAVVTLLNWVRSAA